MGHQKILLGLIGFPLDHSWSPAWFKEKFTTEGMPGAEYRLFAIPSIEELPGLLNANPSLTGLNVTIPYKEKILPYLDEIDETAQSAGAVNTVKIRWKDGVYHAKGYNTDAPGFIQTIAPIGINSQALILGTGGASKAVAYALKKLNIPFRFVSRRSQGACTISYEDLSFELIRNYRLIINTTPLGMYPDVDSCPEIPFNFLTRDHILYDLVYNPEETRFLKRGKAMNAKVINGKQMLINQAELSYEIFMNTD